MMVKLLLGDSMDFNIEVLSDEDRKIIEEVENMLVPELMAMADVGEKQIKDALDDTITCDESEIEDKISALIGAILTLRYYNDILDKRDVDNMKVGDLKKEYEEWNKKLAEQGE